MAEAETIYRAAGECDDLASLVSEMIAEHRDLASAAGRLPGRTAPGDRWAGREDCRAVHRSRGERERRPAPGAACRPRGQPGATAREDAPPHSGRPGARPREPHPAGDADATPAADPAPTVLSLLLEAATELTRAGQADRACRLAASAWVTLRGPRPGLAALVTAALHGLAQRVAAGPAGESNGARGIAGGQAPGTDPGLDVRALAPAHAMSRSSPPTTHFPRETASCSSTTTTPAAALPVRRASGEFTWDYLETGPKVWRVRIGPAPVLVG
jgi:hypothetical protein